MNKYLFKNKRMILFFIILIPLACLLSIKFALSFEPIINSVLNKEYNTLKTSSVWCAIYGLLDCIMVWVVKYVREALLKETFINLKNDLFSNIIKMNVEDFSKKNIGNYISILDNDLNLLSRSYFDNYLSMYSVAISFIFSFLTVCFLNYTITIILIVVAICSIMLPKAFKKKLGDVQEEYSEKMKFYTSQIKDFFEGFQVIKSFNIQGKVIDSHEQYNISREATGFKSRMLIYSAGWISMIFSTIMYISTFVVGGYFSIKGAISVGLVVSLSQLIGGVVAPLEQLPAILSEINSTFKIRERLQVILDCKDNYFNGVIPYKLPSEITLNNVSFSYNNSDVNILNNLNFKFKEGKKYAIVGESGSGKSTVAKLLLKFYQCNEGEVKIDDEQISNIDSNYLYNSISYIHQNVFLFDDTLRANITLYKEYDEDDVLKVIELAGLSTFVRKLPNGIYTNVGENGSLFSGGERQRIGIARALICKSKFLILDEATSSLDNITGFKIYNSVLSLKETASIIITHQLNENFLSKCDCIYVMKNGSIIEEGTFEKLLEKKGYFYNLYSINI